MDLVVKGRRHRVTDRERDVCARKLARLERTHPRAVRCEVEIVAPEHGSRTRTVRVDAALDIPRRTFRASGEGRDVDSSIDQVVDRLDRQLRDHAGRRRRKTARGDRLHSAGIRDDIHPD
jgi:ribosomal subunit interface protein